MITSLVMDCIRQSKITVTLIIETEHVMAIDNKSLSAIIMGVNFIHLDTEINNE